MLASLSASLGCKPALLNVKLYMAAGDTISRGVESRGGSRVQNSKHVSPGGNKVLGVEC